MNSKSSFDPTPRLISSPIQILFFPFSLDEEFCDCGNVYSNTCLFQKYCKNCSSEYIKKITNFNAYLDIYDGNGKHLHAQNITLENSHFKQIVTKDTFDIRNKYLNYCKLCCNERSAINCSVCYLIFFTWIEFTSTSSVLHLPWWDTHNQCIVCDSELEFKSNCQKWCSNCFIIYTGCRYCLTTNIIFGITEKSQCMKCKRLSLIDINMSSDVKKIKEYFLKLNTHNFNQIANYVNNIDENSNLLEIYSFIKKPNYFPLSVLCSHIANLAGNNENSLNLTIPIMFIPFRSDEYQCYCCKKIYSETPFFKQQYCKDCLQWYIKYAISNIDSIKTAIGNLDAYACTTNTVCNTKHKQRNSDFCIQEWCENCSEISYFKRIIINQQLDFENIGQIFEKNCSVYSIVSFTWMEFTSTSPVLHLPWWDTHNQCIVCDSRLEFKSDCQKWCSNCFIIYTGCRYCLTTNIIFGNAEKSQCMKCKRLSWIDINMPLDMKNIEYFLKFSTYNFNQIANFVNNIDKNSNLLEIYSFIKKLRYLNFKIYSQIIVNLENNGDYLTIPFIFIPFKNDEDQCYCCENIYSETPVLKQKYCKHCLYWCINYATNNLNIKFVIDNLDVCIRTTNTNCEPINLDLCIRGWCEYCSEILYFKQMVIKQPFGFDILNYFYEETCRLCKKLMYKQNVQETFKLCSNCYSISFEFIESTLAKNHIPILHLQWWDADNKCIMCNLELKLKTDYQKWCSNCIIIYTGCRYCLTTNIIFGITEKSQCMKCKRLSWIDINMPLDMKNIEYFLKFNTHNFNQIANFVNNIDTTSNLLEIYSFIKKLSYLNFKIYSQIIANLENNGVHSTIPNMFIPFKNEEDRCYCCENTYSETLFKQKYCKYCLYWYINYATCSLSIKCAIDNLDVCIRTTNTNCDKHEPKNLDFCIQEWCENCSEILYFKQIVTNQQFDFSNMNYFYKESCRLCKKSIYEQNVQETFKLCFNCYSISFEFIESTLVKNHIPILHLQWWDAYDRCIMCNLKLKLKTDYQKWCSNCIIIYTGCRYCLTTNIIFGIIEKTQCMKCKRLSWIDINMPLDMKNIEYFLKFNTHNFNQIANFVNNIDKTSNLLEIYSFIKKLSYLNFKIYSQIIANLENNGVHSTIPNMFIPFKNEEDRCYCCENTYSETLFKQKYCKYCLYWYINYATCSLSIKCAIDNLDVCIRTTSTNCDKHEPKNLDFCIQEWCENCSEILYFKQIVTNQQFDFSNDLDHFYEETCRLCKKLMYKQNVQDDFFEFKLCFNCYPISFEFIESTLVKNHIPILHLQWWDAYDRCIMCNLKLKLKTDYQKWCSNCIIIYTGCRYCLTTNIIFGIIEKTQCMKCKRLSWIDINMPLDMKNIEYFLKFNTHNFNQIANFVNNIDKTSNLLEIYSFIKKLSYLNFKIYSQIIANLENNGVHSTIPNMFIPFKNEADRCYCCENTYSETLFKQKYCKYCLYWYINYATCSLNIKCVIDNLDICIRTTNTNCDKHEPKNLDFCIQEWCENCSEILYFKQIVTNQQFDFSNMNYFYKENCRLCKKSIYKQNVQETFKLCFNCYSISFEFIESTLVKNRILILYLPWWDAYDKCIICHQPLESKSNCQKYCSNCPMVYTGCRFCLTTNIIFGYINQSQCKRCKRIERIASIDTIDFSTVSDVSGNYNIDEFLNFTKFNVVYDYVNNINKNSNPLNIYKNNFASKLKIEWIPYYRITNLKEIAEGGYGKIYKASINGSIVAIKEFLNSQDPSKYFLNEIKSLYKCYDNKFEYIIKCHGITKNLMTNKFMFIMKYANGGDLHNYLQENFTKITWKKKMHILWRISDGLQTIHEKDFIHRDFHSGNILVEIIEHIDQYLIGDLGLSQPANNTLSANEIYGVIPYVAPEIFKGAAFSKASDIYSMGMIMWELTTGCKPFANIEHDINLIYKIIDGRRPEITDDTPEDFINLIKKCWNPDPRKRPSAKKICESFDLWANMEKDVNQFNQAEEIRLELIQSKLLGPESIGKSHSKAIYTSRPLSSFISKSSSTNASMISFKQEYVTKEYEFDINDIQRPSRDFIIENSNSQQVIYTSKPLSKLISEINPSGKRNIEDETQANGVDSKHVKISDEINPESQE